ncbi:NAC domain-containing protein 82-like isoform X1 [Malus sylvestris]|uniref:NAC domain-containing protein 82-like isoform X1 n=2 Tax=Malus sylvestris TaxID=3752 RepID=UPI0021ABC69E|nr:NAC domain-containing protein 82-like isoform X1 [Malus sylvestris]XP_050108406.1 NAC domain-containing protein 82-like isoform X1 [Malus sylvestris]XP_050108407.1 NAC domain-containing protein 82-like isoform X1 [Malus sylvestris]XP_050108408.1 NAC domain-containing protein 82-like isoform X1 [Malus sylvestris]XP_050108409.1 NAC domain-containing protein 82-like isoform X1 [Malus sylvestris]XP_050108410.1 NAC domain-containing protein 82-like isoform X1 [Malus sylvestris]XP_050108411.1 NA
MGKGKSSLPPGFRFSPTDVELVQFYLKRKVMGKRLPYNFVAEVDIHKYAPWDLPEKSSWQSGDLKWYFFCPTERKYPTGARAKRTTERGYWKATGNDRSVLYNGEVAGKIKTLIFHTGRAPKGERTDWVMHEYRLESKDLANRGVPQESYVLCTIFQKEGPGPKNGAQYGAPLMEEDWSDDEAENCSEAVPHANMPEPNLVLPSNYNSSITTSTYSHESIHIRPSSESCISDAVPLSCHVPQLVSSNHATVEEPHTSNDDDILSILACFSEESPSLIKENEKNEELGNVVPIGNASATPHVVSNDIYVTLGDLGKVARVGEDGCSFSSLPNSVCATGQMPRGDDGQYLELDDLGELFNYQDSTHTRPPSMFGEPQTLLGEMPFQGETG